MRVFFYVHISMKVPFITYKGAAAALFEKSIIFLEDVSAPEIGVMGIVSGPICNSTADLWRNLHAVLTHVITHRHQVIHSCNLFSSDKNVLWVQKCPDSLYGTFF